MRSETSTLLMSVWKLSSSDPFGPRDGSINPGALRYLQSRAAPPTSPAPAQTQFVFCSWRCSWCLSLRNKKIFTCFSAYHVFKFNPWLSLAPLKRKTKKQKMKSSGFTLGFPTFLRSQEEHTDERSGRSEVRRAGSTELAKAFTRCSSQRIHARRCGVVSNLQLTCPGSEVAWARKGKQWLELKKVATPT